VGNGALPTDLKLPFSFAKGAETKVRLARQGELDVDDARWDALEEHWSAFWKSRGKEPLQKGGKAVVGGRCITWFDKRAADVSECFWVDLMLKNPLDVDVALVNLTVMVECAKDAISLEVEVIDNVVLRPKESRVVGAVVEWLKCSLMTQPIGSCVCYFSRPGVFENHALNLFFSFLTTRHRDAGRPWIAFTSNSSAQTECHLWSRC